MTYSMKDFINTNMMFWHKFKESDSSELILVQVADQPVINHSNAVVGKMIAIAKNLRIAWLENVDANKQLMKSYSLNSVFISFKKLPIIVRLRFFISGVIYYASYILIINRIHSFKYRGIPYGDFIYDGYLVHFSMATLHRFDIRLVLVFYELLVRDEQARLILSENNIKAVLVAHYIGLNTGPLSRVAMQQNIPVYWKGGGHGIFNLSVFNNLEQIYDYPKKPTKEIIDDIVKNHKQKVESDFNKFINQANNPYYGVFSVAYDNVVVSDVNRESFLKTMNLDDKPTIFVMLHAFNDHPHSHFKRMLFDDYYDWFIETYKFAVKEKSKNWLFKEHPANKFYITKDLDLKRMMKNPPSHIRFIAHNSAIKASTVLNVADMIVTCLGTAGLEMPALRGIPSIIAGDTYYDGFGFTIEPRSRKEYFDFLRECNPDFISSEQQLRAKCCYLYYNKYCMMPFAAGPPITYEEASTNSIQLKNSYPERILDTYRSSKDIIYAQFAEYVSEIRKEDFKHLVKLPFNDKVSNNELAEKIL